MYQALKFSSPSNGRFEYRSYSRWNDPDISYPIRVQLIIKGNRTIVIETFFIRVVFGSYCCSKDCEEPDVGILYGWATSPMDEFT